MARKKSSKIPLPTPLARRFVRYFLGFGIAVGASLTPFLMGKFALLKLFPASTQRLLIPFVFFLMGFIAVAVQFYSGETIRRSAVKRRFKWCLASLAAGVVLFISLYGRLVVTISMPSKDQKRIIHQPFVVGFVQREGHEGCGCEPGTNRMECIEELTFDETKIESCWNTGLSRWLLQLSYLFLNGSFAALIGLLLLQEEARKQEESKPAGKRIRKTSRPNRNAPPVQQAVPSESSDRGSDHGTS